MSIEETIRDTVEPKRDLSLFLQGVNINMNNWQKQAEKLLKGRTIIQIQWMTKENAEDIGWYKRPLLMVLDNGTIIHAQADDEGNDGGALYIQKGKESTTLPVF